jgi:ribosomal protein L37E
MDKKRYVFAKPRALKMFFVLFLFPALQSQAVPQLYSTYLANTSFSFRIAAELARLERNRERRFAREKAKGITAASPSDAGAAGSPGSPSASTPAASKQQQGTQRKCANCGQVGHIKTNKKCAPGFPSHHFVVVPVPVNSRKRKGSAAALSTPTKRQKSAVDAFTADPDDGWMFEA